MMRGLFVPRDSPVHRCPPGLKLAALPLAGTTLFLTQSPMATGGALALALLGFGAARLPVRLAIAQLRPVFPVLAVLFLAQLWLADLDAAMVTTLRVAALVLLAALVTLTTPSAQIVAVIERLLHPFRPFGVSPEKIGLALSLFVRFVPAVAGVFEEVREAQQARDGERNLVALAVPLIVRTLKMADEIADAIDARS